MSVGAIPGVARHTRRVIFSKEFNRCHRFV
jgi:hypothetical protein